jgi:phage/plasmid-like protein (TIGR03299 family)
MPHYFESGFSVRKPMWHGLGTVLPDYPTDVASTCRLAGLDWEVAQRPLLVACNPQHPARLVPIEGRSLIVRRDREGTPEGILGITTVRYTPVQNEEMVRFCFDLLEAGREEGHPVQIETAGSLMGGRVVWALARLLNLDVIIPNTDDVSHSYLLVTAGHDGLHAFKAALTSVRVVCWNTLSMALAGHPVSYTIRHVGKPLERIKQAARVLGLASAWTQEFQQLASFLAKERLDALEFVDFMDRLLPLPKDDRAKKYLNIKDSRGVVQNLFVSTGEQMPAIAGTRWAALQAVTEYTDWHLPVRSRGGLNQPERRFLRSMVDNEGGLKMKALELLAAQ